MGEQFAKAQQDLIDDFKRALEREVSSVLSKFYTDITPYAETDIHINYYNRLREEMREELMSEFLEQDSVYSWAATCREILLKTKRHELQNAIIKDLEEKLRIEKDRCLQLERRRY